LLKILDVYNSAKTEFLTIEIPFDFKTKENELVNFKDMNILLYMRKLSTKSGRDMFKPLPWDVESLDKEVLIINDYVEHFL
jgi:hypothetical protein